MPLQATSGAASYDGFGGGPAAVPNYIEDVFSTWLYAGNSSTQTITNGIDLSTKGGLVWIKSRSAGYGHYIFDTNRGALNRLASNGTGAESSISNSLTSFLSNGFSLGSDIGVNESPGNYASWTFRKQPKFFDIVTYTGNGTAGRTISHSLGSVPGCIIIKKTSDTENWGVYHRSLGNTQSLALNLTNAAGAGFWNSTTPTSTVFTVGNQGQVNDNGQTYVAYLFAHDAGGFGLTGTDNVISCGSFTVDGAYNGSVTLGYEPQWVMLKMSSGASNWFVNDNMRSMPAAPAQGDILYPNLSNSESLQNGAVNPTATGFVTQNALNAGTYIYIAIRRGPMKTPTTGTSVFTPTVYTGTNVDNRLVDTTIAPDMVWVRQRNDTVLGGMVVGDRLRAQPYLLTGSTAAEVDDADAFDQQLVSTTEYGTAFSSMTGFWCGNDATAKLNANTASDNHVAEAFKRAPGFFDVVCYTGNGTSQTVTHNLGVTAEFGILKNRSASTNWPASLNSPVLQGSLNTTSAFASGIPGAAGYFRPGWATNGFYVDQTTFSGQTDVNASGYNYVAYLFASCPGVSKVFSFTGNGSSQTINCGFTGGARFVMIKRTDSTGDWYVWDSARGIVSGNDPRLSLNTTAAEVTTDDSVDTDSTGFVVNQLSATNVNVNGATYIGLAIA